MAEKAEQMEYSIDVNKMRMDIQNVKQKNVSVKEMCGMFNMSDAGLRLLEQKAPKVVSVLMTYHQITGKPITDVIKENQ
ncbi:hypothetical protein [Flavobacterium phage FCOV-F14]|uniref:Uncharacterized protein n=8 Tax=Ficleduovirus FCL2 TaxID=2560473 RepID=A0A0A0YPQ3_9CAUD|nr:hypothetical protein ABG42_gp42 [Flavobacterium phage FCL-2]QCW21153.1 hypothetical protein [Flavobacterium phage FCOV-F13]QCW21227.1 hypothetical protein [Flavobacterium phage FCOV-F16]QCW21529.1 hypothetical protein [Flavobacterium phage FCOV-F45]QCW21603.1 hypothetical protein [Flavobacterium phage FCOV-F46]QCW21677.1 hypothetical protein [Flavobacterium phage FCOV-F54]QNJ51699.1 hypothetical protein [Flavobacterium phage FCOV-F14]QNJ51773.1 hypothetical protein [Flavobacterium phage F